MKSKSPWFGSFQSIISQLGVGIGAANRHAHCPTWLFQAIFALKIEVRAINNANYNTNDLVFFCLWMVGEKFSPNNDIINYSKKICNEIGKRYCFWILLIGSDGDHAHFFIGAGTKYFPSKVMQIMKSITTRRTFREYSEIETQLWDYELSIDMESTLELELWHNLWCNLTLCRKLVELG